MTSLLLADESLNPLAALSIQILPHYHSSNSVIYFKRLVNIPCFEALRCYH